MFKPNRHNFFFIPNLNIICCLKSFTKWTTTQEVLGESAGTNTDIGISYCAPWTAVCHNTLFLYSIYLHASYGVFSQVPMHWPFFRHSFDSFCYMMIYVYVDIHCTHRNSRSLISLIFTGITFTLYRTASSTLLQNNNECKYDLMCNVHKIKETLIQINIFLKHTTIWWWHGCIISLIV